MRPNRTPLLLSPKEREWYGIEGMAHGIYQRHAAALARKGTHTPQWGWLTEEQRETWRDLARERRAAGWDAMDGFEEEGSEG